MRGTFSLPEKSGLWQLLQRYCCASPCPRAIRAGSPASAGGAGFGKVAMKSEKPFRSSSDNGFAISFIGSKLRSFSRNMNSWISA